METKMNKLEKIISVAMFSGAILMASGSAFNKQAQEKYGVITTSIAFVASMGYGAYSARRNRYNDNNRS